MRLDKYLKVSRIIKRRTVANDACDNAHVTANGRPAKASYDVKVGDVIVVRKGPVTYTYKVLALVDKRQGPKLVPQYAENLTPQEELDKLHAPVETFFLKRDRGAGRPTKKDRRQMDELWDSLDYDID